MSGSGSGSGGGSGPGGGGGAYISVGGITVQIPYVDTSIPHAQQIQDISLCVAILQMASYMSNSTFSTAVQSAATNALGLESAELAQETRQAG
jgi:hypothetical protein